MSTETVNEKRQELISALACALNTLRGEAGGYSPEEKKKAINTLQQLYQTQLNMPVGYLGKE